MFDAITNIARYAAEQALRECTPKPPADPNAPGFQQGQVERGPNGFDLGINGPDPLLATGGTHDQQESQRDTMIALATLALGSYISGHTPGTPRVPSDGQVGDVLADLDTNPPIGTDGTDVTHAVYQSTIPNATPEEAYAHFVNNPEQVFGAGAMEIRPPTDSLQDGGRYMLEIGGPVPTWLPVEIRLDPANNAVTINTLDGHVLRGEQTFTFTSDCNGGAVLTQDARFQSSGVLPEELQQLTSISQGQHEGWQEAHREIYEQFNGNPGYEGMGTDLFNAQQLGVWAEALTNFIADPGNAADVIVDSTGEVLNAGSDFAGRIADWGIDGAGSLVGDALDAAGIPGGGVIRGAADAFGDGVEWLADGAGDVISDGADIIGDGAEVVIDTLNPFD